MTAKKSRSEHADFAQRVHELAVIFDKEYQLAAKDDSGQYFEGKSLDTVRAAVLHQLQMGEENLRMLLNPIDCEKVSHAKLLYAYDVLCRSRRLSNFSARARRTIEAAPMHYFHLTNMPLALGVWKHHVLHFQYNGGLYEAETSSNTGRSGEPPRRYRYCLYGSDSRCFIYGRETSEDPKDGPGERIFPDGVLTGNPDAIAWAGVGLWNTFRSDLVFSRCLVLSALRVNLVGLQPLPPSGEHFPVSTKKDSVDLNQKATDVWENLWPRNVIDLAKLGRLKTPKAGS